MLALLRRRNFALLWFGGLISLMGDYTLFVGLPIYVYQLTGSTLATSGMFVAGLLPHLLVGSIAGVFVDRWDRKRTLVIANVALGLLLLPLLLVRSEGGLWVVYLVALLQSAVGQFVRPAENALLPTLVEEEHLLPANALNSLNNNIARLVGPPLGGAIAATLGLTGIALIDAASFFLAALLIALISKPASAAKEDHQAAPDVAVKGWVRVWREWLAGLRVIKGRRDVSFVTALLAVTALGEGVFSVLFLVFVSDVLHGGARELGRLMGAQAVGGLIGGTVVGWVGDKLSLSRLLGFSSIAFGLGDLAVFNYPAYFSGIWLGVLFMAFVGVPGVGFSTSINTLLQSGVEDGYRGRVFAAVDTTQALMQLIGTLLAGTLGGLLSVVTVLNVQGAGYIVAGLLALSLLPGEAPQPSQAAEATGVH